MDKRKSDTYYLRTFITVWAGIILLFWAQKFFLEGAGLKESLLFLSIFVPSAAASYWLSTRSLKRLLASRNIARFIVDFVLAVILTALFWALIFNCIDRISAGNPGPFFSKAFWSDFLSSLPSIIVFNICFCGIRFYFENMEIRNAQLETRIKALQQVDPHFMFNVLNNINMLISTDPAQMERTYPHQPGMECRGREQENPSAAHDRHR